MMKKKYFYNKIIAGMLTVAVTGSGLAFPEAGATAEAASAKKSVIDNFTDPTSTQKPMVRMWFPDAAAGEDESDTIELQIKQLAEAGFGGIEVAYLADGSLHSNTDAQKYGWGTENWNKTLKKILKAANAIEGGFIVDLTFTPHWPLCINTIDPNDEEASNIQTNSFTKVTGTTAKLSLPSNLRTQDNAKNPFIFTDTFVSAALVQVKQMDSEGKYVLDYSTMKDITDKVTQSQEGGYKAGIPDEAYFNANKEKYGWSGTYESAVVEVFGDEPENFDPDASDNVSEKIDKDFKRARMADYQYIPVADLKGMVEEDQLTAGEEINAGDWIVVTSYQRGSGQIFSDGAFGGTSESMVNNLYVPNYMDKSGIDVVTDYWDKYILSDQELYGLMEENARIAEENGGTPMLFEDSLELTDSSNLWTKDIQDSAKLCFGEDYQYADVFGALYAIGKSSQYSISESVSADYNTLKDYLFAVEHYGAVSAWSKEKCAGYGFRVQHDTDTLAVDQKNVDIIEGDNGSKGDGLRQRTSFKNLYNKGILSMEAVTGMETYSLNWADVLIEVGQNYSQGVNHVILHGSSYNKSCNGYNAQWPGWSGFGSGFADDYNGRDAYWDEADNLTGYMARSQAVLQSGVQKVDVAVLESGQQTLLDNGYSYDILSDTMLTYADPTQVKVNDQGQKIIYADGPSYKALIVRADTLEGMENKADILSYAAAGFPVYVIGEGNLANVTYVADKEDSLLAQLKKDGITASASYEDVENLTATHYEDEADDSDYYFLYNDYNTGANNGMLNAGVGNNLKAGEEINTTVTLEGDGVPYIFDAVTGDITPVAAYTRDGDSITMDISLESRESLIVGIVPENVKNNNLPKVDSAVPVNTGSEGAYEIVSEGGKNVFKSNQAGTYQVTYEDGFTQEVTIEETKEAQDISQGWNLTIESFGPDYQESNIQDKVTSLVDGKERFIYYNPSQTLKTGLNFTNLDLSAESSIWANLDTSDGQLDVLNSQGYSAVKGSLTMKNVSGTGTYKKEVTLENWDAAEDGAILNLAYYQNEVTSVKVNGRETKAFNNITDNIDISRYLKKGINTIEVKVATTMLNRALVENEAFDGTQKHPGRQAEAQNYGLKSASLDFYTKAVVSEEQAKLDQAIEEANKAKEEALNAQKEAQEAAKKAAEAEKAAKEAQEAAKKAEEAAKEAEKKSTAEKAEAQAAKEEAQAAQKAALEEAAKAKAEAQTAKDNREKAEAAAKQAQEALAKLQAGTGSSTSKVTVKKTSIRKAASTKKKQAKITWKKLSKVDGYQVQYSTSKKFKNARIKTAAKASASGITLKKLKSGKKYYVRVRAYKVVDGTKTYSAYSAAKQVKVK
mgnify:CR=1 FL=1